MVTATKYIGIGGVTTLLGIFLWFMFSDQFITTTSQDVVCSGDCINPADSDCIGYFNVTAKYKSYTFYNKENKTIEFGKNIRSFDIGINDKRYKDGFKPFDFKTPFISGVKYVLKLEKGKTRTFRVRICKNNPTQDIKWSFSSVGVPDPIFHGINVTISNFKSCLEETNYFNITKPIYGDIIAYRTHYDKELRYYENNNSWYNFTYENGTELFTYQGITGYDVITKSKTTCERDTSYLNLKFGNKTLLLNYSKSDFNCSNTIKSITCDSCIDGNCDGKLNYDLLGNRIGETFWFFNATHIIGDNSGDGIFEIDKDIEIKNIILRLQVDKSLSKFLRRLEIE